MFGFPTLRDCKRFIPPGGLLDPSLRPSGGSSCPTPGMKIRSRGMGRGLGRGKGRGPIGIPYRYR